MKMTATKDLDYGRQRVKAGEPFEAEDRDGQVLEAAGLAKSAGGGGKSRSRYTTRMMTAANEVPNQPKAATEDPAAEKPADGSVASMTTANAAALKTGKPG